MTGRAREVALDTALQLATSQREVTTWSAVDVVDAADRFATFLNGTAPARTVGRCGRTAEPLVIGDTPISTPVCALPAAHSGRHRDGGMEWTDPTPPPDPWLKPADEAEQGAAPA